MAVIATQFDETNHVISNTYTDGPIFDLGNAYGLSLVITNNGASALNAFELWWRPRVTPSTYPYFKIKSSGFTTPDFFLLQGIIDPVTLASGATSSLMLNVDLIGSLKLVCKSAGTSNLTISGASFA
jgi:hypothetical protein